MPRREPCIPARETQKPPKSPHPVIAQTLGALGLGSVEALQPRRMGVRELFRPKLRGRAAWQCAGLLSTAALQGPSGGLPWSGFLRLCWVLL